MKSGLENISKPIGTLELMVKIIEHQINLREKDKPRH